MKKGIFLRESELWHEGVGGGCRSGGNPRG